MQLKWYVKQTHQIANTSKPPLLHIHNKYIIHNKIHKAYIIKLFQVLLSSFHRQNVSLLLKWKMNVYFLFFHLFLTLIILLTCFVDSLFFSAFSSSMSSIPDFIISTTLLGSVSTLAAKFLSRKKNNKITSYQFWELILY